MHTLTNERNKMDMATTPTPTPNQQGGGGGGGGALLLYDEYAALTQKYKALYGADALVLMEVGSFLEFYDCDRGLGADVPRVCAVLGVQMTRKSKAIAQVSRTNPCFGGVPRVAGAKYVQMLVDAGFSVAMCMQVTPPPNIRREVTEVVSRATCSASTVLMTGGPSASPSSAASPPSSFSSPLLLAMYVERGRGWLAAGWATVDLTTGRTSAGDVTSTEASGDVMGALDALKRVVAATSPAETVLSLCSSFSSPPPPSAEELCAHVGLTRRSVHERRYEANRDAVGQNLVLSRAFPKTGFLTPAEYVDLERRPHALAALVAAIEFAWEHNEAVVARVAQPTILSCGDGDGDGYEDGDGECGGRPPRMVDVGPDTLRQLDVVVPPSAASASAFEATSPCCLLTILNRCRTAAGKRGFRDRLLNPVASPSVLQSRYDAIDALLMPSPEKTDIVRKLLDGVGDIERLFRRVVCLRRGGGGGGGDIILLATWLANSRASLEAAGDRGGVGRAEAVAAATAALAAIEARVEVATSASASAPASFFRRGVHPTVDAAQDELDMARAAFFSAATALNAAIGSDHVKVETGDAAQGVHLAITARRWQAAVASGAAAKAVVGPWFRGSDATLGPGEATGQRRLEHPALGPAASERVARASAALAAELHAKLCELLDELAEVHSDGVRTLVREIEALDVASTCARNALDMGHVRPSLVPLRCPSTTSSSVRAVGLRHPIVESLLLDRGEPYVANDVALGCGDGAPSGLLLYGVNAVGKSSTMKAIGLAVLMAQAGMYVAAESLELAPFTEIYTRVGLRDDLARGHSTFVVEMLELRAILKRAGRGSLVIGDELCAGTESASALAIVGAGVARLVERESAFVLATHLHELVQLPTIQSLADRVHAVHLSVRHDEASGRLVMDRRLAPGTGPPTYGLEVCRSLDMDPHFLKTADVIRRQVLGWASAFRKAHDEDDDPHRIGTNRGGETNAEYEGGNVGTLIRKSRYNARVVVDCCGVCGAPAEETHHIVPQAIAEARVKNRRHNLVSLCRRCHDATHAGNMDIEGYKMTSDGIELISSR